MSDKSRKNKPAEQPDQAAWLQIYKAQKTRMPQAEPASARGRPARIAALTRINTMISASDKALLMKWQAIFKMRTGRSLTLGEVAGLLAHICMARMETLGLADSFLPESVDELVALLIGEGEGRASGG
jgi:hypothetical protein